MYIYANINNPYRGKPEKNSETVVYEHACY